VANPDDNALESRLAVVERELARLREEVSTIRTDSQAARVLAAGADRDVTEVRAELRAHTQALNALRETQLEQQAEMQRGFGTVNAGMMRITELLERIADE
jgi:chromosome segregation ATPase